MKRILTEQEVEVIHFCHHDHCGYATSTAAIMMKISQRRVQQLLNSAERKAPQLFPILSTQQNRVKDFINDWGMTFEQIASELKISVHTVDSVVTTLKEKGVFIEKRKKTVPYQNFMDSQVKEKF